LKAKCHIWSKHQGSPENQRAQIPPDSIQAMDSWTALTGPFWRCWSLPITDSQCLRFDAIYRAEAGKTKPRTHIAVWALLTKAASGRKPGKIPWTRFQASWMYPLKPTSDINVPHLGLSTPH